MTSQEDTWIDDLSTKYPRAAPDEADAHAWVFLDKENFEIYPFKFPELGDDDARAQVISCPIGCYDIQAGRGVWGDMPKYYCPGHDCVARITHVGKNVTTRKVGDIVGIGAFVDSCGTCENCVIGNDHRCVGIPEVDLDVETQKFGGVATAVQYKAKHMHLFPEGLDPKTDGQFTTTGEVPYRVIKEHTTKGQKIAIIGIGAVGHLAVQFAVAMGLEVTAFTTTQEKVELIKNLGAHHVVVTNSQLETFDQFENHFDVFLNLLPVADSESTEKYLSIIKPCGKFIQIGTPGNEHNHDVSFSFYTLIAKQIEIIGHSNGPIKNIEETLEFAVKHKLKCVCELYDFEDFPKAVDRTENGRPLFKCVLLMEDYAKKHNLN